MSVEIRATFKCDQCKKTIQRNTRLVRVRRGQTIYLPGVLRVEYDPADEDNGTEGTITIGSDVRTEDAEDYSFGAVVCSLACAKKAVDHLLPKLIAASKRRSKKDPGRQKEEA